MLFKKFISIFIVNCCYFVPFTKQDENEGNKQTNQLLANVVLLKESLIGLQSDLDKLHDKLNVHSDLVNGINTNVLLIKNSANQCESTDQFYHNMDTKLMDMQQTIQKTLKENSYKKINEINSRAVNKCPAENTSQHVIEIRNKIVERLKEYDKHMKHFDILEEKLNFFITQMETQPRSQDLSKLQVEIHYKLSSQGEKLKNYKQELPKLLNVANRIDNYTRSRKNKSSCKKEKCILYSDFHNTKNSLI